MKLVKWDQGTKIVLVTYLVMLIPIMLMMYGMHSSTQMDERSVKIDLLPMLLTVFVCWLIFFISTIMLSGVADGKKHEH